MNDHGSIDGEPLTEVNSRAEIVQIELPPGASVAYDPQRSSSESVCRGCMQ